MPTLRKRVNAEVLVEDQKNQSPEPVAKKPRTTKATSSKKTTSTKKRAVPLKQNTLFDNKIENSNSSNVEASKKANAKIYATTCKKARETYNKLEKRIPGMDFGMFSPTADEFSAAIVTLLPSVKTLLEAPANGPVYAFNLLMCLADHSYAGGDLTAWPKICGFGDTDKPFKAMDELLVQIIDKS
ncbi:hypothetical protein BT63DRAFT_477723 [Microthyrium microscopicum]|uniref:Uncharacterized protein n=1 Tax=Microthyrium microscopicum TaxID=703497 RepID=A0A6A6UHN0_9PEZI|nr:hypothetical protein BT63DRAFT_477723 [Microthyrium microscopicum]